MPRARPVYKDATIFMTRRACNGELRMPPTDEITNLVGYLVTVSTQRYKLELNAFGCMSNHYHSVAHDLFAKAPDFSRDFHHFLTKHLNARFRESGTMWQSRQTSHVYPKEPTDTIGRIAYTVTNPVKHGVVENTEDYTGFLCAWPDKPRQFHRPDWFFSRTRRMEPDFGTRWPAVVTLTLARPRGFDDLSDDELAELIGDAVRAEEERLRAARSEAGLGYLGMERAKSMPRRFAVESPRSPRATSPRIAAKNPLTRLRWVLYEKLWRIVYDECLFRMRDDKGVAFPPATFKLRRVLNVPVAETLLELAQVAKPIEAAPT